MHRIHHTDIGHIDKRIVCQRLEATVDCWDPKLGAKLLCVLLETFHVPHGMHDVLVLWETLQSIHKVESDVSRATNAPTQRSLAQIFTHC